MQRGFIFRRKTVPEHSEGFTPILIVILIAAAVGGYFVYTTNYSNNQTKHAQNVQITQTPAPTTTLESTSSATSPAPNGAGETANWKTYAHSNFTFKYPDNWYSENNQNYPGGNNVSFFLVGTKADHGYGDHKGNEVFSFEFSEDSRSLEELKRDYYQNAVDLMVGGKPAIKTSFNLLIVKPSKNKNLNIVGGIEAAKPYIDQILLTFKFQ